MARSVRYEIEEQFSLNVSYNPTCEECETPTRSGAWVEDTDGYSVFACSRCVRTLTADTHNTHNLISMR